MRQDSSTELLKQACKSNVVYILNFQTNKFDLNKSLVPCDANSHINHNYVACKEFEGKFTSQSLAHTTTISQLALKMFINLSTGEMPDDNNTGMIQFLKSLK